MGVRIVIGKMDTISSGALVSFRHLPGDGEPRGRKIATPKSPRWAKLELALFASAR
jgi:hypothetical protein